MPLLCPSLSQIKNGACWMGSGIASTTKSVAMHAAYGLGNACEKASWISGTAAAFAAAAFGVSEVAKCNPYVTTKNGHGYVMMPIDSVVVLVVPTLALNVAGNALKLLSHRMAGNHATLDARSFKEIK